MTVLTPAPRLKVSASDIKASICWFPFVGFLIGVFIALMDLAFTGLAPSHVRGVIDCLTLFILTRGLHLDGLCDTADAIFSGKQRQEALRIMKDSRIGSLGAITVFFILMLKASSLGYLSDKGLHEWMVVSPSLSRYSLIVLAALSRYARDEGGLGMYFVGRPSLKALFIAVPIAIVISYSTLSFQGLIVFIMATASGILSAILFKRLFNGVTGDCLGAHLEVFETLALIYGVLAGA